MPMSEIPCQAENVENLPNDKVTTLWCQFHDPLPLVAKFEVVAFCGSRLKFPGPFLFLSSATMPSLCHSAPLLSQRPDTLLYSSSPCPPLPCTVGRDAASRLSPCKVNSHTFFLKR